MCLNTPPCALPQHPASRLHCRNCRRRDCGGSRSTISSRLGRLDHSQRFTEWFRDYEIGFLTSRRERNREMGKERQTLLSAAFNIARIALGAFILCLVATDSGSGDRSPAFMERYCAKEIDHCLRAKSYERRLAGFCAGGRAHCHVRQRRLSLGRAAHVFPVDLRARPREGAGTQAS